MPGTNGIDLALAIRSREEGMDVRIPLVALTSCDDRNDHDRCLAAGVDEILEKPVDGETLTEVLARRLA